MPAARYQLGAPLGHGGMGEVVTATDIQIGRTVAIKRMRVAGSAEAEARFLREARVQGGLDHPAIVPVHELAHDDAGRPYFVMKRLTGTTLAEVLAGARRGDAMVVTEFTRQRLLRAFADVCLAVEFAHQRGVVHRDLKPANVMLGDFGEVYVIDWGIAHVIGDHAAPTSAGTPSDAGDAGRMTEVGAVLGTPGYMAPEQVRGDAAIDGKADVYALGCVLFELLAGEPLHAAGTLALVTTGEGVDGHPARRAPDRDVPPELDGLCASAVALDPDARPTARALGAAVQRYLDGDRDIATRRSLAAAHLDRAREASARGDDPAARATAMREAGRALALDPTTDAAAALLGRLILEPPRELPPEVEAELGEVDAAHERYMARIAFLAFLGYLAFVPLIAWIGVTDWAYLGAFGALIGANALLVASAVRRRVDRIKYVALALNALLIAGFARVFSPFLVAPGMAAVTLMVFASHPRLGSVPLLWSALAAGVLTPWALELAGVWSTTTTAIGGSLVLTSPALDVRSPQAEIVLVVYVLIMLVGAATVARSLARSQDHTRRVMLVQAWHLRQLVQR